MERRQFLIWCRNTLLGVFFAVLGGSGREGSLAAVFSETERVPAVDGPLTLFLAGDVMTGRGIDQVLPHSVDPRLHEPYVKNARRYVELAEEAHGPIPAPVSYDYIWGNALDELAQVQPDARIINLETAVTTSDDWWQGKGIHYRMHPENVPVFTTAGIDITVLGNNHVMDWGRTGLRETLSVLQEAGIQTPGAGLDQQTAAAPAVLDTASGRLLVFSYGSPTAGIPRAWAATEEQSGVNFLSELSPQRAQEIAEHVQAYRREGDRVIISIHWGGNWGYEIPPAQREFAHQLIDAGAADIIHGHSSHHPKGIEVYQDRLILYGSGDLINDYEGIGGHEQFRPELTLMYFPVLDSAGALVSLEMTPMRIRNFQLQHTIEEERRWLAERLERESRQFGARVERTPEGKLVLRWE